MFNQVVASQIFSNPDQLFVDIFSGQPNVNQERWGCKVGLKSESDGKKIFLLETAPVWDSPDGAVCAARRVLVSAVAFGNRVRAENPPNSINGESKTLTLDLVESILSRLAVEPAKEESACTPIK